LSIEEREVIFMVRKSILFIAILFFFAGNIYSQQLQKNELTFSIGGSYPTSGNLHTIERMVDHDVLTVGNDQLSFQVDYLRFINDDWAWRLCLRRSSFELERANWDCSCCTPPSHTIPVYSLNFGFSYYYGKWQSVSPYVGGGVNFNTTTTKDDYWFKVNYPSAEVLTPKAKISVGPYFVTGISWKIEEELSLRVEAEYDYNGFTMARWYYSCAGRMCVPHKSGDKLIRANPVTISVGISFKW